MVRDVLRGFQRPVVLQVRGDVGRQEGDVFIEVLLQIVVTRDLVFLVTFFV